VPPADGPPFSARPPTRPNRAAPPALARTRAPRPQADGHSQCPAWMLAWPYRKQNLLRELLTRRPDIMCLQEVQSDHYK
jgi:hypothetical protein